MYMMCAMQTRCLLCYVCMHVWACVRACVRACVQAGRRGCVRACVRACVQACVRACKRVCVRACVCACMPPIEPCSVLSYMNRFSHWCSCRVHDLIHKSSWNWKTWERLMCLNCFCRSVLFQSHTFRNWHSEIAITGKPGQSNLLHHGCFGALNNTACHMYCSTEKSSIHSSKYFHYSSQTVIASSRNFSGNQAQNITDYKATYPTP